MKIIENPPQDWVHNLREGCEVWLTKERVVAAVVAPFTRPVSSYRTGRLFIRKNGVIDYWFVSSNGKGIDGSTIMQPLEGSLPETPVELRSSEAEELRLEISKLRAEVAALREASSSPFGGLRSVGLIRVPLDELMRIVASSEGAPEGSEEAEDEDGESDA